MAKSRTGPKEKMLGILYMGRRMKTGIYIWEGHFKTLAFITVRETRGGGGLLEGQACSWMSLMGSEEPADRNVIMRKAKTQRQRSVCTQVGNECIRRCKALRSSGNNQQGGRPAHWKNMEAV